MYKIKTHVENKKNDIVIYGPDGEIIRHITSINYYKDLESEQLVLTLSDEVDLDIEVQDDNVTLSE